MYAGATIALLGVAILLVGSLAGDPAFPDARGGSAAAPAARGVYAITRHPMMWAIALWGGCPLAVYPIAANIIVAAAMSVLAPVAAALRDHEKSALQPRFWPAWRARTSYLPFAAIVAGRARLGGVALHALAGGALLWLAATCAHIPLAGWAAGIWRWIG